MSRGSGGVSRRQEWDPDSCGGQAGGGQLAGGTQDKLCLVHSGRKAGPGYTHIFVNETLVRGEPESGKNNRC